MQLIQSTTNGFAQFASLSLVLKNEAQDARHHMQMVEPMLLCGPLATVPMNRAMDALRELHSYLSSTITAAMEVTTDPDDQIAMGLFKEDARQMDDMQIFTPHAGNGLGMCYRLIRTEKSSVLAKLSNIIMVSNKSNSKSAGLNSVDRIWGFLLCVGMGGQPLMTASSALFYRLGERINDCKEILTKRPDLDTASVKTLLSTMLLFEDDARMTNSRDDATRQTLIPEIEDEKMKAGGGFRKPKRSHKHDAENQNEREDAVAALDEIENEASRLMSERIKVLSVAESGTLLRKYSQTGFERKANLDLTGGSNKSRFSRKRSGGRDADFESFDYKGPIRRSSDGQTTSLPAFGSPPSKNNTSRPNSLRQPAKDTKLKAPVLSAPRNDGAGRRRAAQSGFPDDDASQMSSAALGFNPFGNQQQPQQQQNTRRSSGRHNFDEENDTVMSQARLQVNIALNEDLACSYRSSQISSCSVEGVVQVQVKATSRPAPFFLLMRDPSQQVQSFQENRRFADDVSDALIHEDDADRKYTISVPNGDSYFPVVRYKCVDDLRPVPIRVQTRAKVDGGFCRVALQISSNPNNEAKLTDLTIIMGVPEDILGETLATQPAGGVWNSGKRCVTWCVEELGEGEKFQLQARFQMDSTAKYDPEGEKPTFPVLVRCQCLFAQLSDVELEIRDIPEVYPADVTMKIARRFRLSHRERA